LEGGLKHPKGTSFGRPPDDIGYILFL